MLVHYLATAAWTFLHAVGVNYAINAYNRANSDPGRDYQLLVYANAWNNTLSMFGWGIVLAATYGGICFTAVAASSRDESPSTKLGRDENDSFPPATRPNLGNTENPIAEDSG